MVLDIEIDFVRVSSFKTAAIVVPLSSSYSEALIMVRYFCCFGKVDKINNLNASYLQKLYKNCFMTIDYCMQRMCAYNAKMR